MYKRQVVKGIVKAFTKNDGTIVNEIDKNSTIISIENTGTTSPDTPTTGKGSLSDPYNVAEAIAAIKAGTAPTTQVYLTGIISDVAFYNETYKSITYYISDDGKSKDMQVYSVSYTHLFLNFIRKYAAKIPKKPEISP